MTYNDVPGLDDNTLSLLADFFEKYAVAPDRDTVIAHYCQTYPEAKEKILAVVEMGSILAGAPRALPDRLGPYRVLRVIGAGGMGEVFEALEEPLDRRVAVKTIRTNRQNHQSWMKRFFREREALAKLHHTNIVPILAAGEEGDLLYFAMPYIRGATLEQVIRAALRIEENSPGQMDRPLKDLILEAQENTGKPGTKRRTPAANLELRTEYVRAVVAMMANVADAVFHANQAGVIHRDLKPANLMVESSEHPWVVDYGLARIRQETSEEPSLLESPDTPAGGEPLTNGSIGTEYYKAPEQSSNSKRVVDARTDVWGLGVVLFELLSLRRAFASPERDASTEPPRLSAYVKSIPRDLEEVVVKALEIDPDDRYPSAQAFAEDLRRWLDCKPVSVWPTTTVHRKVHGIRLWSKRNRGWSAAIAITTLAVLSMGAVLDHQGRVEQAALEHRHLVEQAAAEQKLLLEKRERMAMLIQNIRLSPHNAGWFENVWTRVREAAELGGESIQGLAAASLQDLDAVRHREFKDFGAGSLAFDKEGKRLIMGGVSDVQGFKSFLPTRVLDGIDGDLKKSSISAFGPVGFRPDGTPIQLAIGDNRTSLTLYDLAADRPIHALEIPGVLDLRNDEDAFTGMSADGAFLGAPVKNADGKPTLAIWEGTTGKLRYQWPGKASCVAFSSDGSLVASGDNAGRVVVRALADGHQVAVFHVNRLTVHCLAFHHERRLRATDKPGPEGQDWLLAVGGVGGTLSIWEVGTSSRRAELVGNIWDVYNVAFSPDGTLLAACGRAFAMVYDASSGERLLKITTHSYTFGLAFSSGGKRLALGSYKVHDLFHDVVIWDLQNGHGLKTLRGLKGQIHKTILTSDDRLIAGLSHEWEIGIWDRATGALRWRIEPTPGVFSDNSDLAFSADGRRFAFSADKSTMVWDLDSGGILGEWKLPPGLDDRLSFEDADHLILVRHETADGVTPSADAPTKGHPRVAPFRRLTVGDPDVTPFKTVTEFPRGIKVSQIPGKIVYVTGKTLLDDKEKLNVYAYDVVTGKHLWTVPGREVVSLDSKGSLICRFLSNEEYALMNPANGSEIDRFHSFAADLSFGPGGKLMIGKGRMRRDDPDGVFLFDRTREKLLVRIGLNADICKLRFAYDGKSAIWGNHNGTVTVFELGEVNTKLRSVGLGW